MCGIRLYRGPCRVQYGKKFLSLEKFYTHIVADVADYYEVWVGGSVGHRFMKLFRKIEFFKMMAALSGSI